MLSFRAWWSGKLIDLFVSYIKSMDEKEPPKRYAFTDFLHSYSAILHTTWNVISAKA